MAQLSTSAQSQPVPAGQPSASRARLILQDPMAFDQASTPALRSSLDLTLEASPVLQREQAREIWDSLSLPVEQAQEKQSERKRLLAKADALTRESSAAKASIAELQTRLEQQDHDRLNHPLVYAGAVGLLGLGAMYWLERRKRMQLQEEQLDALAVQTFPEELSANRFDEFSSVLDEPATELASELAAEEQLDFADDFATDLSGLPDLDQPQSGLAQPLVSTHDTQPSVLLSTPDWAVPAVAAPLQPSPRSSDHWPGEAELLAQAQAQSIAHESSSVLLGPRRMLSRLFGRKNRPDAVASSHLPTEIATTTSLHTHATSIDLQDAQEAMQWLPEEEARQAFEEELLQQQVKAQALHSYSADQANIELLSQTRVKPRSDDNKLEHLLELRTAVGGLCVLGRPEGAMRLLEEHIASNPDTCAWAYLELMHICEQLDKREPFETIRKRYRQQFNRMAPYWYEPNANVLGLDGYARAAHELCAAWLQGKAVALNTVSAWLVGPMIGRKLVQLPAYHDLFDLYEMLEYIEQPENTQQMLSQGMPILSNALLLSGQQEQRLREDKETNDFVPTVSLLDLDYEFSSDVILEEKEVLQAERSVTSVKTGNFSVDFNVAGTQMGGLPSVTAELPKK